MLALLAGVNLQLRDARPTEFRPSNWLLSVAARPVGAVVLFHWLGQIQQGRPEGRPYLMNRRELFPKDRHRRHGLASQRGEKKKVRGTGDPDKVKSAAVFHEVWKRAEADPRYAARKKEWKVKFG